MGTILFYRTKSVLIARTLQRKLRLPLRLSVWRFFLTGGPTAKQVEHHSPPVESEVCPISHAQCETRTNAPVLCFPVPELYLPQLKLRGAPCSSTPPPQICHLLQAQSLEAEEQPSVQIRFPPDFLLGNTP